MKIEDQQRVSKTEPNNDDAHRHHGISLFIGYFLTDDNRAGKKL